MSPLNLSQILSHNNWVYLLIGIGFGIALELSGFGDSRKLAAQFYFNEMRVLKVMFTAIITAMLLVFFATSIGLLDFNKVYVNPTYLWPGIVGGVIMGVGFIIGGFCPGTSLVGAATLKMDAIIFLLGVLFGVFLFGESEPHITQFFNSSFYGRLTIFDLMGIDAGWVVLVIFIFAIVAFLLAEWGESFFNQQNYTQIEKKSIIGLAALGFTLSLFILIKGQPNLETRWSWIADQQTEIFQAKEMFIHPAELRDLMINPEINLKIYDLRSEEDYNLFHIENSQRISQKEISSPDFTRKTAAYPPNTVSVLIANNDVISGETWKNLKSLDYMNFYVLDGGINNWLDVFPLPMNLVRKINPSNSMDPLKYDFSISVGDREYSSFPYNVLHSEKNTAISYVKKVKLQKKTAVKGGCG